MRRQIILSAELVDEVLNLLHVSLLMSDQESPFRAAHTRKLTALIHKLERRRDEAAGTQRNAQ